MKIDSGILRQCWILTGPTAVGKTSVAMHLAERLDAEIIALDSMTLYRGMDIGTAKPSADEQARVDHHLIDIVDPHEEFSLAEYVAAANEVCLQIVHRGRVPLFVGGTGLYLRGILRGVFEGPPADWELRRALEQVAHDESPESLHAMLADVDADAAARLHPNDTRRLVRALEVVKHTGRPLSEQQREQVLPEELRPRAVLWLDAPREWLYARIDQRVVDMIDRGLVDEIAGLLAGDDGIGRTAAQGLGYKEIISHLNGECSLDEAVELIQRRSRQFAKRQCTWFRNLTECRSLPITGSESVDELTDRILDSAAARDIDC